MTRIPSWLVSPGVRTLPNVPLLSPEVSEPRAWAGSPGMTVMSWSALVPPTMIASWSAWSPLVSAFEPTDACPPSVFALDPAAPWSIVVIVPWPAEL